MGRSTGSGNNFLQVVANNFDVLALYACLPLLTIRMHINFTLR